MLILTGLVSAGSVTLAQDANGERTVFLPVTVTDQNGLFLTDIERTRFSLSEKKVDREITVLAENDQPVSVALVIDQSGSQLSKAQPDAAWTEHFIGVANRANDYLILGFNSEIQVLCDWGHINRDLQSAVLAIAQPKKPVKSGSTALYDAVAMALKKLETSKYPRRVMILITDGLDNNSKVSFPKLRESLRESDVTLFAIGLLNGSDAGASLGMDAQGILDELAWRTGGKAFFPRTPEEFFKLYLLVAGELRYRYTIGIKLTAPPDHQFHKIELKLLPSNTVSPKKPRLAVRYKAEYYDR
jgi:VWFA-related protein